MYGRILIVDGQATNRILYKVKLSEAFYRPLMAADGQTGLSLARSEKPELILLDLNLPDMPAKDMLRQLRCDPFTRAIPVIALTGSVDPADRLLALSEGADDVMSKPVSDLVLLARVRNLLRSREEHGAVASAWGMPAHSVLDLAEQAAPFDAKATVALISTRSQVALQWKHQLQPMLRENLVVMPPDLALILGGNPEHSARPDVYVIDLDHGANGEGLRLMSELTSRSATRHAAFCLNIEKPDADRCSMAFDLGADDVITSGLDPRELALRLRILIRRKRQADRQRATVEDGLRLAVIDPLTGIYNRRYAMPRMSGIAAQAAQEGSPFAVMVVDLDRFKAVNDRFGHSAGDLVLTEVARRLSENLRMTDLLARIGGEEFLVVLPQTSFDEAQIVAHRLRQVIAEHPIPQPSGPGLFVTASIGVAMASPCDEPSEISVLVDRADRALLQSKTAGRNQVTFAARNAA